MGSAGHVPRARADHVADAAPLDAALARYGAVRRYAVAGNLALVAWPDSLDTLSDVLRGMGLTGPGARSGPPDSRFIGAADARTPSRSAYAA